MGFLLFLLLLLPLASTQATYHIRPTSDSPCPHEDCLTLSEYASQNRNYSNSDNLTLIFLPGEHVLNSSIVFQWPPYDSVTLLGNDSSLPNITSKIVCNECSAFSLIYVSKVEIRALGFETCGQITPEQTASQQDLFGLLKNTGNVVPTVSALFVPHFHLTSCRMDSNYLPLYGYESAVHSQDCEFTNNTGAYGGAVLAHSSTVEFTGQTLFQDNIATKDGGAMFISASDLLIRECAVFLNNKAEGSGGAITIHNSRAKFHDNVSSLSAVIVNTSGHRDQLFEFGRHNFSDRSGGAVCVSYSRVYFFDKAMFQNNTAVDGTGGGMSIKYSSMVHFEGFTEFIGNSAGTDGGGIFLTLSTVVFRNMIIFSRNMVQGSGGGICTNGGSLNITGLGVYTDNTAALSGGAVSIADGAVVTITREQRFERNVATIGGAVALEKDSELNVFAFMYYQHIVFSGNQAVYGGAIFSDSGSSLTLKGTHQFVGNVAKYVGFGGYGGAIYALGTTLSLGGWQNYTKNTARYGGAIAMAQYAEARNLSLLFTTSILFYNNYASKSGGAIFVEQDLVTHCGSNESITLQLEKFCFLRVTLGCGAFCEDGHIPMQRLVDHQQMYVTFDSNYAEEGGDNVYGGELENCIVHLSGSSGIELLAALAREPVQNMTVGLSSIASGPFKVCMCNSKTLIPDCSLNIINKLFTLDRESPSL